jgi:hypothetical protein
MLGRPRRGMDLAPGPQPDVPEPLMAPMTQIRSFRPYAPIRGNRVIRCSCGRTNKANFRAGPGGNALRTSASSVEPRHYEPGAEHAKRSQSVEASAMRRLIWTPTPAGVIGGKGRVVQTKPIGGAGYPIIPLFHHSSIPVPSLLYKRSQIARGECVSLDGKDGYVSRQDAKRGG